MIPAILVARAGRLSATGRENVAPGVPDRSWLCVNRCGKRSRRSLIACERTSATRSSPIDSLHRTFNGSDGLTSPDEDFASLQPRDRGFDSTLDRKLEQCPPPCGRPRGRERQLGRSRFLEAVGGGLIPAGIAAMGGQPGDGRDEDRRARLARAEVSRRSFGFEGVSLDADLGRHTAGWRVART